MKSRPILVTDLVRLPFQFVAVVYSLVESACGMTLINEKKYVVPSDIRNGASSRGLGSIGNQDEPRPAY
jgi:hypothetical protein